MNQVDSSIPNSINQSKSLEAMPKGLRILFLVYLHTLNKDIKEKYTEDIKQFKEHIEYKSPEVKMHDFVGHILLGMVLSKLDQKIPSLDLQTEPSIDFEEEVNILTSVVLTSAKELKELFDKSSDDLELGDGTRSIILKNFEKSSSKLRFVRELLDVIDEKDWYNLGVFITEVTGFYEDPQTSKAIGLDTTNTISPASIIKQRYTSAKINTHKDYLEILQNYLKNLFEQYSSIMRASKVYEFRRHLILLEWFQEVVIELDSPNADIPSFDKPTITKLQALHDEYRYELENFMTIPDSEETKEEMEKFKRVSGYIYQIMEKLMEKYLNQTSIAEEIKEEFMDTINDEVETLSASEAIARQLMAEFNMI